jgi:D-alanyl-D-alanine carboxypeptidase
MAVIWGFTFSSIVSAAKPPVSIEQIGEAAGFNGIVLLSRGEDISWAKLGQANPVGLSVPQTVNTSGSSAAYAGLSGYDIEANWRWASVTKQIVAVLVLQEVAKGTIELDKSLANYLPSFKSANAKTITVRNLLRHQSGLPNPDDTLRAGSAIASYYLKSSKLNRNPLSGNCAGAVKGPANGNWAYNNCDYIVAGALLKQVTGKSWFTLFQERIAGPLQLGSVQIRANSTKTQIGFAAGKREPAISLAAFDSSGALSGSIFDLWKFDRALMTAKLLPRAQLNELWDGQADLGYIALGQWVFEAPLKGCDKAVRIVERRGAIGGVQVRNFILPDQDAVVIAFTNRGEFDFGEVWQGAGLSHDLLAKAACS